jgi:hypothetical protein
MFDLVTRGRSSGIHLQTRDWLLRCVQAVAGPLSADCISLAEYFSAMWQSSTEYINCIVEVVMEIMISLTEHSVMDSTQNTSNNAVD